MANEKNGNETVNNDEVIRLTYELDVEDALNARDKIIASPTKRNDSKPRIDKTGIKKDASVCLNEFVNTLKNVPWIDLAVFYENLKPYSIIQSSKKNFKKGTLALYDMDNQKISYNGPIRLSIFHELLHMASSAMNRQFYIAGFNVEKYDKYNQMIYKFGLALNEGYTQLLAERYFKNHGCDMACYTLFVRLASYMEVLVGRQEMETLFFKMDLRGLVARMTKYGSYNDVIDILRDMDSIFNIFDNTITYYAKFHANIIYQRVLVKLSEMLKRKQMLEENDREIKAVFYSMRAYTHTRDDFTYKAMPRTVKIIVKNEKSSR